MHFWAKYEHLTDAKFGYRRYENRHILKLNRIWLCGASGDVASGDWWLL